MKMFLAILALALAAPVAAQTAPADQGHQQHGQQPAQPGHHQQHGQPGQQGQHQQGEHHCACCADRNGNGRMDCCEEAQAPAGNRQGD